ncbi:MAG: T9SS type A sorting domain-containing protein [Bacteroidota bacterium]
MNKKLLILAVLFSPFLLFSQWQSSIVWKDADGRLNYQPDAEGNKIPDFSHAGYRGGGIDLPMVPNRVTIGPIAGDNTAHIQAAIDSISALTPDTDGYRGAVLLDTGRYEIQGTLTISANGVVLRGSGNGADPSMNTVLAGVGNVPSKRTILVVGGGTDTRWEGRVPNTSSFLTSEIVYVGDRQIRVEHPEYYAAGDNVVINHPCTNEWLQAIDDGGVVADNAWTFGSQPLTFNRRIVSIDDSTLTLDVPLYNTLNKSLSPSFVYKYDRAGLVTEVGVENLRIEIETTGPTDEAHAWNALALTQVEDAWVTNCTFLHFGLAGILTQTATRITIQDCEALDPHAEVVGGNMYNFDLLRASSQVLVRDCRASNGRHHYVSNGTSSVSGCVFLHCESEGAYTASEGHRRWSMGLLFDNQAETATRSAGNRLIALFNRGDFGTGHGWAAAHSVAWNCDADDGTILVQKPPTAQNYAIGCNGQLTGNGPFPGASGFIEGTGQTDLAIPSLYLAQLEARLAGLDPVITNLEGESTFAFNVYPNPSGGELNIMIENGQAFEIEILNLDSQEVATFRANGQWEEDFSELPDGVYLIEIRQAEKAKWVKWIKD